MYQKKPKNNLTDEQMISLINKVSDYFQIEPNEVVSKSRKDELVKVRMFICVLLKNKHKMTLKKIGEQLSGRDHSSILYMLSQYKNLSHSKLHFLKEETNKTYQELEKITNEL
jgi:chromosomal replication initiator protein